MLIRHLTRSIRNVPGAILRLLRAILLSIILRVRGASSVVPKFLHLFHNPPAPPTSPRKDSNCEPLQGGASYSAVPTSLAPVSLAVSLPSGLHSDNHSNNLPPSLPSPAYAPDIPPAVPITTLNIIPFTPEAIQRQLRRKPIEKKDNETSIGAGKIDYSEKTPGVWERIVHPEGARYFFDPHKQVFTDMELSERNLVEINQCISVLREKENKVVPRPGLSFEETPMQLVIQLDEEDGKREWLYYFVNHKARVVFWVDELETTKLSALDDLRGVTAVSHIGYAIEMQYWFHCEQYPNCSTVSQDHVTEFRGILAHACADRITSEAPLSTLNEAQLAKLLTLAPYLESRVGVIDEYALWIIARVMSIFAAMKFYNFYGQPGARLEANTSVYVGDKDGDVNSFLFAPLDISLFYSPSAHIKTLKGIWVDNIINYARWEAFSSKLSDEWSGITIYSTVMLAVDVAFLAVPGINGGDPNSQSVAMIALYMSLLTVVGSLTSALLLARQMHVQEDSASAASFIYAMTRWSGFNVLGIVYSLPFALLIWAMIFFVLALCYFIFVSTDRFTLGLVGTGAILVGNLVLLPVWWGQDYSGWASDLMEKLRYYMRALNRYRNSATDGRRYPSNPLVV